MAELLTNLQQQQTLSPQQISTAQLNEYHVVLNRLFARIENATTHYELLELQQTATYEEVLQAYQNVLAILYPSYKLRMATDEKLLEKMDAVFNKISWAFAILANFRKRADYHTFVLSKAQKAQPAAQKAAPNQATSSTLKAISEARKSTGEWPSISQELASDKPVTRSTSKEMPQYNLNVVDAGSRVVYNEFGTASKDDNRRRSQRFKLQLPARVAGFDRVGNKWHEMAQTIDVSRTGVTVTMKKRVRQNTVLYLSLPLPTKLRTHGFADAGFNTYVLVRRVEPLKNGVRTIALEFIGEHPPAGFLQKPWATFRPNKWAGQERRRNKRENRVEKIHVEYFNESLAALGSEDTFTENISQTGMRIFVKNAPFEFDIVRVRYRDQNFESLAAVRNRYIAKDGTERLCLHFINSSYQPL